MEYLQKMKDIQNIILEFLDNDEEDQKLFDDLKNLLTFQQDELDAHELKSILYLISTISTNHHRTQFFFDKIKKIIIFLKNEIKKSFSNDDIYELFEDNKLLLLILLDEGIFTIDYRILSQIEKNHQHFFYPEIIKIDKKYMKREEIPELYDEKRRKGENDSYICELIRTDNIENFIIYTTRNCISLSSTINKSIYETNSFLEDLNPSLIEYSAFYGSIQIFKYLFQNQIDLTSSLWLYAIHGNNPEIIHFLEENQIYPEDKTYKKCLEMSIKCHHNDFALYFQNNFIDKNDELFQYYYGFHYYNFQFIPVEYLNKFFFYWAVKFDYFILVDFYYNKYTKRLDDDEIEILINIFK